MNMPRPSMLWIYGLIGAFIIGWYVFGDVNDTPLPSDWTTCLLYTSPSPRDS